MGVGGGGRMGGAPVMWKDPHPQYTQTMWAHCVSAVGIQVGDWGPDILLVFKWGTGVPTS